jgi:hypothetical protein
MSQDIVPFDSRDLVIARPPEIVLEEARKAAVALKEVIDSKPNPVLFNGEKYLEFEDWQTVGRFYGISPRIVATKYVEFGDIRGWEAHAQAVQVASERIVSSAEAMCLNDEDKWRSRPKYEWVYVKKSGGTSIEDPGKDEIIWVKGKDGKSKPKKERQHVGDEAVPLFQLRSMAQTRACAKAMRQALAWVVVLAGFKPTPAEELDGMIEPATPQASPTSTSTQPAGGAGKISFEQEMDLAQALSDCDKGAEAVLLKSAGISRLGELPAADLPAAMKAIAQRKQKIGAKAAI